MKHTYMDQTDCTCSHDNDESCWVCRNIVNGGLGVCRVCGGAEGTLTTDCCGRRITPEEEDQIYRLGTLDFVSTRWVYSYPNPLHTIWNVSKKKEKIMTPKEMYTNLIVRSKKDPSVQIQLQVNNEDHTVGVVMNSGMELLVIETTVLSDMAMKFKPGELP
jgi:hypothetical protein